MTRDRDMGNGVPMPPPIIACGPDADPWAIILHSLITQWADETCGDDGPYGTHCDRVGKTLAFTSSDGVRWLYRFASEADARYAFAGYEIALARA